MGLNKIMYAHICRNHGGKGARTHSPQHLYKLQYNNCIVHYSICTTHVANCPHIMDMYFFIPLHVNTTPPLQKFAPIPIMHIFIIVVTKSLVVIHPFHSLQVSRSRNVSTTFLSIPKTFTFWKHTRIV